MANTIDSLTNNGEKISILASSGVLNDDMLITISNEKLEKKTNRVAHVDKRDGFYLSFFQSDFVIVTSPPQTHLLESGQQVIIVPSESILNHENIGKAYKKLSYEFKLSNGVSAYIYKKERPFTLEEINDFFDIFYKKYPNWNTLYNNTVKAFLTAEISKGDIWGSFDLDLHDHSIHAHPGENKPTEATIHIPDDIDLIEFQSSNTQCNIDDVIRIQLSDSENRLTIDLPKGKSKKISLDNFRKEKMKMSFSKVKNSGCDSVLMYFR